MSLRTKSPFTEFLRENGRSLRWVARCAGIPEKTLRRYAAGEIRELPEGHIAEIARVVGCTAAEIPAPGWSAGAARGRPEAVA
jgi:lambda repressor-like predicted transcriptional regulator